MTKRKAKPKTKQPKQPLVKIQAKCIFGHRFTMSPDDVETAKAIGCPMCPTCGNVATVERIST